MFQYLWKNGPQGNKKNFCEIMKPGDWKAERCFIVGGGPSLRKYNFAKLNKRLSVEKTIGINRAFQFFPDVKINIMSDKSFYYGLTRLDHAKYKSARDYANYKGIKVWVDMINYHMDNCYYLNFLGRDGITTTTSGVYAHAHTGYSAINLAIVLGCTPIYLLGFDLCKDKQKHTHYHDYPTGHRPEESWDVFAQGFVALEKYINRLKDPPDIINLSPISKLKQFSRREFTDILGEL